MNIKEIWKVFKGSSMNDVDMQRAFERAATPNACIELIEENEMLIAALDHIKKHQETVVVGMDKSVVGRVVNGESKKTDHGVYFSDLTLEKAL